MAFKNTEMRKIAIILLLLLISSCGSRKRSLDKKEEKTELLIKKETDLKVKNNVKKLDTISIVEVKTAKKENTSFNGIVADTSKPATVTEEIKDGKKTTTYNNFKEVKSDAARTDEGSIKTENTKKKESDLSEIDLIQKEDTTEKKDNSSKSVKVDRQSGYSWIMWLILSLAIVVYGYFSIKKKQYNPLSWFK